MHDLTFELHGDETLILDDMGEGALVLSQHSEATGRLERIAIELPQLLEAIAVLSPRYGEQTKNTEPSGLEAA